MNFLIMIFQKINFIISYIFANQINEKEIISRVASHENPLVFDIGSNIGEYSKLVSKTLKNKNLILEENGEDWLSLIKEARSELKLPDIKWD